MLKSIKQLLTLFTALLLPLSAFAVATDDQPPYGEAELDQLLAPIALYPDTVLSDILIAATYPLEVVQADRWARQNTELSGDDALVAVENETWDPSVKALVAFPQVLTQMSDDLNWTQSLGEAFLYDEEIVMLSIQKLRERANSEGYLESDEHQTVSYEDDHIIIEPVRTEVVYVPYYDPFIVYGSWWWPHHPPRHWVHHNPHFRGSSFIWTPSLYVGSGFYFSSSIRWGYRDIVVVNNPHRRVYRPQQITHYRDAHRWVHNPNHRHGVKYRNTVVRKKYSNRNLYSGGNRNTQVQRATHASSKHVSKNGKWASDRLGGETRERHNRVSQSSQTNRYHYQGKLARDQSNSQIDRKVTTEHRTPKQYNQRDNAKRHQADSYQQHRYSRTSSGATNTKLSRPSKKQDNYSTTGQHTKHYSNNRSSVDRPTLNKSQASPQRVASSNYSNSQKPATQRASKQRSDSYKASSQRSTNYRAASSPTTSRTISQTTSRTSTTRSSASHKGKHGNR